MEATHKHEWMASLSLSYHCSRHFVPRKPVLLYHPLLIHLTIPLLGYHSLVNAVASFILQAVGNDNECQPNNIAYVSLTIWSILYPSVAVEKKTSAVANCFDVKQKSAGTVSPARAIPP